MGLIVRGFGFNNELVDINFRCFVMCSQAKLIRLKNNQNQSVHVLEFYVYYIRSVYNVFE